MTLFIGLTGSIGMGKSTTAQMFRDEGIAVYDSDATVHLLYEGIAAPLIEEAFPGSAPDGKVDRALLSKQVVGDEVAMKRLEAIVHPLVRQEEIAFRQQVEEDKAVFAILDIPLLFETGGEERVDGIIVVTATSEIQKQRVLMRPDMTEEKFHAILDRQVSDVIKRQKADFIIDTSKGMEFARQAVLKIIDTVITKQWAGRHSATKGGSDA